MLVLSRNEGESIIIITPQGDRVEFLIKKIRNGRVQLGITAPRELQVYRTEILQRYHSPQDKLKGGAA